MAWEREINSKGQFLKKRRRPDEKKFVNPEKYGMLVCPVCFGKGFIKEPKRQACPKCGGFGWIKKEE
jgi:rubrerythrin